MTESPPSEWAMREARKAVSHPEGRQAGDWPLCGGPHWCPDCELLLGNAARALDAARAEAEAEGKAERDRLHGEVERLRRAFAHHEALNGDAPDPDVPPCAKCGQPFIVGEGCGGFQESDGSTTWLHFECGGNYYREKWQQAEAEVARLKAERDAFAADLARVSDECGLPPTIGPAPGEIERWRDDLGRLARERDKALESAHERSCAIRTTRDGWDADCTCLRQRAESAESHLQALRAALDPDVSMSAAWKVLAELRTLGAFARLHPEGDFDAVLLQSLEGIAELFKQALAATRQSGDQP